jgi:hypothetical protein
MFRSQSVLLITERIMNIYSYTSVHPSREEATGVADIVSQQERNSRSVRYMEFNFILLYNLGNPMRRECVG